MITIGDASGPGTVLLGPTASQAIVQATPFSENEVGLLVFPVCVAWNPMPVEPPGEMIAL